MLHIDKDIKINILARKLNDAEQRATDLEALFLTVQDENKMLHEKIKSLKGGENVNEVTTAE